MQISFCAVAERHNNQYALQYEKRSYNIIYTYLVHVTYLLYITSTLFIIKQINN